MARRVAFVLTVFLWVVAGAAEAQQGTSRSASTDTRPATTTFFGDTGLWFVPTAEVLPDRKVSVSAYRADWDYKQGLTDVSHILGTFGVGIRDRVEVFGSFRFDTRIDRDYEHPLFTADARVGGLVNDYPFVTKDWTGDNVGDLLLGAKVNLTSQWRQQPAAFAIRGVVKLPTGDTAKGTTTGKADFLVDALVSREFPQSVELAGYAGGVWRGDPDTPVKVNLSNGFRWGAGAGFPSRTPVRVTTEVHGEYRFDNTLTASGPLTGADNSRSPLSGKNDNLTVGSIGVTWQHPKGVFIGGGVTYSWPATDPTQYGLSDHKNFWGIQARLGYHPGVREFGILLR